MASKKATNVRLETMETTEDESKDAQILGVPDWKAYEWGNTRKKYWRIACSPILHMALNNEVWNKAGLLSLAKRYSTLRHS